MIGGFRLPSFECRHGLIEQDHRFVAVRADEIWVVRPYENPIRISGLGQGGIGIQLQHRKSSSTIHSRIVPQIPTVLSADKAQLVRCETLSS